MPFLPDLRIETTMCSSIENIYVVYLCTIVTKSATQAFGKEKGKRGVCSAREHMLLLQQTSSQQRQLYVLVSALY